MSGSVSGFVLRWLLVIPGFIGESVRLPEKLTEWSVHNGWLLWLNGKLKDMTLSM
ncbi:hypothetical protein [Photobacterium sp. Hal280]|uniref:hypothetical protein n=1 Tax=Photobacterium sp. Hal280 TaxID=3035163 RepID=UPI00301BB7EB